MSVRPVTLKGTGQGIRVVLDPSMEEPLLLRALEATMQDAARLVSGAALTVELQDRPLTPSLVQGLLDLTSRHDVRIRGIIGREEPRRPRAPEPRPAPSLVRRTLRAGQSMDEPGDLLLLGDVNAGAEVRAVGNVIILGALRGVAHAGAQGDLEAVVYAQEFSPIQVRIADLIALNPGSKGGNGPEVAHTSADRIVVEPLAHFLRKNPGASAGPRPS